MKKFNSLSILLLQPPYINGSIFYTLEYYNYLLDELNSEIKLITN